MRQHTNSSFCNNDNWPAIGRRVERESHRVPCRPVAGFDGHFDEFRNNEVLSNQQYFLPFRYSFFLFFILCLDAHPYPCCFLCVLCVAVAAS
jgi:hypothetical protein